jgi:acetyl esterase/lipase
MLRRTSLTFTGAILAILTILPMTRADEPRFVKTTTVYKTVDDLKIEVDVYRNDDHTVRPVLVWIHGGALIMGSRTSVPQQLLDLCKKESYALVSIDYRLAPEVKLPDIAQDVEDALGWVRDKGAKAHFLDPDRIVVSGGSAGGYLTMLTGCRVKPRPRALVAYWGYGDVDGDWYTKPSEFYRKQVPLIERDDALKGVGGKVLTGVTNSDDNKPRSRYYHYLRQNGLWTREITGFDPDKDKEKLDKYCPVRSLPADYPPILMIHGTKDDDVPYEQSAAMDRELARRKLPHELITVEGAGHGLSGGDKKLIDDANEKALAFIRKQLNNEK